MSNHDFDPEFDDDQDDGLTAMVNVSDEPIIVRISQGKRVQRVRIKPGAEHAFPSGYCEDVRGAGKHVLKPILTRQSLRVDGIPRLVRKEQAEEARAFFVSRVHGSEGAAVNEVQRLEAELAAAKARAEVLARGNPKPSAKGAKKNLKNLKKSELQEIALSHDIDPDQTVADLVAAIEEVQ
jgi:hypothetical protein